MSGIGLVEAIDAVRAELAQSVRAGTGARDDLQFPVGSVELTFQVGVTRADANSGKLSIKVLELGRERTWEEQSVHTVTVSLGAPVDGAGDPVKVVKRQAMKP